MVRDRGRLEKNGGEEEFILAPEFSSVPADMEALGARLMAEIKRLLESTPAWAVQLIGLLRENLLRGEQQSELPQRACWTCGGHGHLAKGCRSVPGGQTKAVEKRLWGRPGVCWTCGAFGHLARECPEAVRDKRTVRAERSAGGWQVRLCWSCGRPGHLARNCTETWEDRGETRAGENVNSGREGNVVGVERATLVFPGEQVVRMPEKSAQPSCSAPPTVTVQEAEAVTKIAAGRVPPGDRNMLPPGGGGREDERLREEEEEEGDSSDVDLADDDVTIVDVDVYEWKRRQAEDADIGPVLAWVAAGQRPPEEEIRTCSGTTKGLWNIFPDLRLCRDGLLERGGHGKRGFQAVVPSYLRGLVLRWAHRAPGSGHFGAEETLRRVRELFYWNQHKEDVRNYCRLCDDCGAKGGG